MRRAARDARTSRATPRSVGWAGGVFDLSPVSVAEWRRRGVAAERFTLGHTARWAAPDLDTRATSTSRSSAARHERRHRLLASYAPILARRRCRIVLSDNGRPNGGEHARLPHRRRASATCCAAPTCSSTSTSASGRTSSTCAPPRRSSSGAVVVSEHGIGTEPLVPGAHFLSGRPETLGHLAAGAAGERAAPAGDPGGGAPPASSEHPLSAAAERFAAVAAERRPHRPRPVTRRLAPAGRSSRRRPPPPDTTTDPEAGHRATRAQAAPARRHRDAPPPRAARGQLAGRARERSRSSSTPRRTPRRDRACPCS